MPSYSRTQTAVWATIGVLAILLGIIVAISRGSLKPHQILSPQERSEEKLASTQVGTLALTCEVQYVCSLAPYENVVWIPIYIHDMTAGLALYLERHGYTDLWQATGFHSESAHTIGHDGSSFRSYVERNTDGSLSGLRVPYIYAPESGEEVHPGRWRETITWTLIAPSGKTVRKLTYNLDLIKCDAQESGINGEDYCEKVIKFVDNYENAGNASKGLDGYSEE